MMEYHDFLVNVGNPEAIDNTLQSLPGTLARVIGAGMPGGVQRIEGYPVVRVLGDPGFFRFAMQSQGYCTIVRELAEGESQ